MSVPTRRRIGASALLAAALAAIALPSPAHAAPPYDLLFPAGVACAGFDLGINGTPDTRKVKEYTDANGNLVQIISGKGSTLTFTNDSTDATVTFAGNGSVTKQAFNPDGTSTVVATGHSIIILFPSDVPAGPTTTLHVGRVVYSATATNDFTILSTSGTRLDICAALS